MAHKAKAKTKPTWKAEDQNSYRGKLEKVPERSVFSVGRGGIRMLCELFADKLDSEDRRDFAYSIELVRDCLAELESRLKKGRQQWRSTKKKLQDCEKTPETPESTTDRTSKQSSKASKRSGSKSQSSSTRAARSSRATARSKQPRKSAGRKSKR